MTPGGKLVVLILAIGLIDPEVAAAPLAAAAEDTVVSSLDFENGTWSPWSQSGGPSLSVIDVDGDKALRVGNRANDFDGIQSPTGLLTPGVEHTFTMQVKLEAPGSADVRFVVKPSFTWVGNATVNGELLDDVDRHLHAARGRRSVDAAGLHRLRPALERRGRVHLSSSTTSRSPRPARPARRRESCWRPTSRTGSTAGCHAATRRAIRPSSTTGAEAHGGTRAALVSDRTSQGDGIGRDVTAIMVPGVTYQITAWVKFAAGQGNGAIWLSMQRVNGGASSFDTVAQTPGVTDGAWSQVSARYLMASADTAFLYFETTWPDGTSASFLVDDIVVTALDDPDIEDLTPIKDTVDFNMGVAVDSRETAGSPAAARPPALRPADAGEPHEAGGLVRRAIARSRSIPKRPRSWTSPRRTTSRCTATRSSGTARRRPGSSPATTGRR